MNNIQYSLGIDVGGTLIKSAVCDNNGELVFFMENETPIAKPSQLINYIGYIGEFTLKEAGYTLQNMIGVGIGFPGTVNTDTGIVEKAPNIPGWKPFNVGKTLEKWFKIPVVLNNDANLAVLAEHTWGVASNAENVIGLTLGTGVGGGLILNNSLYVGNSGYAGELGHIIIDFHGPKCTCGKYGCLEAFVGKNGVIREAEKVMKKYPGSLLWTIENGDVSPKTINEAVSQGDKAAELTLRNIARYLAVGLSNLIDTLNPEMIVIGGGLSKFENYLLKPLYQELKRIKTISPIPQIKISGFEEKVGVIGACASVFTSQLTDNIKDSM